MRVLDSVSVSEYQTVSLPERNIWRGLGSLLSPDRDDWDGKCQAALDVGPVLLTDWQDVNSPHLQHSLASYLQSSPRQPALLWKLFCTLLRPHLGFTWSRLCWWRRVVTRRREEFPSWLTTSYSLPCLITGEYQWFLRVRLASPSLRGAGETPDGLLEVPPLLLVLSHLALQLSSNQLQVQQTEQQINVILRLSSHHT